MKKFIPSALAFIITCVVTFVAIYLICTITGTHRIHDRWYYLSIGAGAAIGGALGSKISGYIIRRMKNG